MASDATILVIGTFDTKSDELAYLREQIESQGAAAICMDVSVLGDTAIPVEIDKKEVAWAAGSSIAEAAAAGDENSAMQIMARGASNLSSQIHADGRIDAMVALGGTMGTDLALDCARVLPTGVPKVIVSTVAFSLASPVLVVGREDGGVDVFAFKGSLGDSIVRTLAEQVAALDAHLVTEEHHKDGH